MANEITLNIQNQSNKDVLIGAKIRHNTFGDGTILSIEGNKITIMFSSSKTEKIFQYPKVFEFISLKSSNKDLHNTVTTFVNQDTKAIEAEQERQSQEAAERVKKYVAEHKRKKNFSPILIKVPHWFNSICSHDVMDSNTKQRGICCCYSLCKELCKPSKDKASNITALQASPNFVCPMQSLVDENTLTMYGDVDVSSEQFVVLVAMPPKGKLADRIVLGAGFTRNVIKRKDNLPTKEVDTLTDIVFDEENFILLSEDEAQEIKLSQYLDSKTSFAQTKSFGLSSSCEVLSAILSELDEEDERTESIRSMIKSLRAALVSRHSKTSKKGVDVNKTMRPTVHPR